MSNELCPKIFRISELLTIEVSGNPIQSHTGVIVINIDERFFGICLLNMFNLKLLQ